jgi:hypothetical protein
MNDVVGKELPGKSDIVRALRGWPENKLTKL